MDNPRNVSCWNIHSEMTSWKNAQDLCWFIINYKQQKNTMDKKKRVSCFNNCFQGQKPSKTIKNHNMSIASQ